MTSAERPTRRQYAAARAITRWYVEAYQGTDDDPGAAAMFTDPAKVGAFAVERAALAAGEPRALFKVLIACTMFQRRQDQQILRVLRGISPDDAAEITSVEALTTLVAKSPCPRMATSTTLREACDLKKIDGRGACDARPALPCHLKRHTELLKRYGHFGKVPTSAALTIREAGVHDLRDLYHTAISSSPEPEERAAALEDALTKAWRISEKIAAMFLSAVSNPDLSPGLAPWSEGLSWRRFVAIDSNVDLFLEATGYAGRRTYAARRAFIERLARRVDLKEIRPDLRRYNPRLVQQAIYLFMSASNRRAQARDCSKTGASACSVCPGILRGLCALEVG